MVCVMAVIMFPPGMLCMSGLIQMFLPALLQSRVDDVTDDVIEPQSSPESPVTLQIVSCSACGSSYGSIICSACGRGYHRDCHVPPVGPDIRY